MFELSRGIIKERLPILTEFIRWYKRRNNELSSLRRHISRKRVQSGTRTTNEGIIKVVFICQYIPAWSKCKQLYETLNNDTRFKIILLCIPNRIIANHLSNPNDLSNDTYDYFSDHGYKEAVNALIGKDEWFDLKGYYPDYVIYNRYDRPMPVPYTSKEVACYAKVCLIRYAHALIRFEEVLFDKQFAANTYCLFAESKGMILVFNRWNTILCKLRFSHAVYCGIPAVENIYKAKGDKAEAWGFSKNSFRVIYSPRWTLDPAWGGSSFPKYGWAFVNLADEYPDMDILLRPHPLMFDHFVNTGVLGEKDIECYKESCDLRKNIKIDTEKEYHSTFWNSGVLICDYSSIIVEYFVTNKPIIYMTYDDNIDYTDQMRAILECCYIIKNGKELERVLVDLKNGEDPLKVKREELCEREFISNNINTSEKMKEFLVANYSN